VIEREERAATSTVALLTSAQRDRVALERVLSEAGFEPIACASIDELCAFVRRGIGTVILTEESLTHAGLRALLACLDAEPAWSDLPLILLTQPGASASASRVLAALDRTLNATIIERPVRRAALVSALLAAKQARKRQHEIRAFLDERASLLAREQAARREAERSNRLKDEFLATLSHELRTPLSAMLGWVQVSKLQLDAGHEVQKNLNVIERNARIQAQLIEDLLDLSRIVAGKLVLDRMPVSPSQIVRSAVESMLPAAEAKGVQLELADGAATQLVRGDQQRLHQVVWNVLGNALKFTPSGGRIAVRVGVVEHHVQLEIQDTGIGIRADALPLIFERFLQADSSTTRVHGGLGLGLSIVRSLVEMHGGTVRADSDGEGQGARFTIRLPLLELKHEFPTLGSVPDASREAAMLPGVRVLVVEDEDDMREMVRRVLESRGARVSTARSAREGFDSVCAEKPDVIVSDIGMPGEDGYVFMKRVRGLAAESGGSTPAIALTAYVGERDERQARAAKYQAHLGKPCDADKLVETIRSVLAIARSE
jgi:signal transduction histidine kinase/ActR/RegA family two-component response regulator